jgi:hypothetical protein
MFMEQQIKKVKKIKGNKTSGFNDNQHFIFVRFIFDYDIYKNYLTFFWQKFYPLSTTGDWCIV